MFNTAVEFYTFKISRPTEKNVVQLHLETTSITKQTMVGIFFVNDSN